MVTNFEWLLFCVWASHTRCIYPTHLRASPVEFEAFFCVWAKCGAFIPGALALRRGARMLSGSVFCVWASHAAFILAALAPLPGRMNFEWLCFCSWEWHALTILAALAPRQDARKFGVVLFLRLGQSRGAFIHGREPRLRRI
jgi:hypothetical protein